MFNTMFATFKFNNSSERKLFKTMFDEYCQDLPENFYLNQFDLMKKYTGTKYEEWVRIFKHPAFDSWKAEQIALIATTTTDKALAGGAEVNNEALSLLKMRQSVLKEEKKVEKPIIIVIPESLYFKEDD